MNEKEAENMNSKIWKVRIWEGKALNGSQPKIERSFTYIVYKSYSKAEIERQLKNKFGEDRIISLEVM